MKTLLFALLMLATPTLAHAVPVTEFAEVTIRSEVTLRPLVTVRALVSRLEPVPVAATEPWPEIPIWIAVFSPYEPPVPGIALPGPDSVDPLTHTPEPLTLALLGGTLVAAGIAARKRRRAHGL